MPLGTAAKDWKRKIQERAWGVGAKAVPCQTQTCRMTRTEKANYTLTLTVVLFV